MTSNSIQNRLDDLKNALAALGFPTADLPPEGALMPVLGFSVPSSLQVKCWFDLCNGPRVGIFMKPRGEERWLQMVVECPEEGESDDF